MKLRKILASLAAVAVAASCSVMVSAEVPTGANGLPVYSADQAAIDEYVTASEKGTAIADGAVNANEAGFTYAGTAAEAGNVTFAIDTLASAAEGVAGWNDWCCSLVTVSQNGADAYFVIAGAQVNWDYTVSDNDTPDDDTDDIKVLVADMITAGLGGNNIDIPVEAGDYSINFQIGWGTADNDGQTVYNVCGVVDGVGEDTLYETKVNGLGVFQGSLYAQDTATWGWNASSEYPFFTVQDDGTAKLTMTWDLSAATFDPAATQVKVGFQLIYNGQAAAAATMADTEYKLDMTPEFTAFQLKNTTTGETIAIEDLIGVQAAAIASNQYNAGSANLEATIDLPADGIENYTLQVIAVLPEPWSEGDDDDDDDDDTTDDDDDTTDDDDDTTDDDDDTADDDDDTADDDDDTADDDDDTADDDDDTADDDDDDDDGKDNPGTGVVLAVIPAIVAGAAVVVARKRK